MVNAAAMNIHVFARTCVFIYPGRYLGVLLLSQVVSHLLLLSSTHPINVPFFIAVICFSLFLHIYLPLLGYEHHYSKH